MSSEQAIRDSELRYRRLFEAAQDGILILDAATGMIKDVNAFLIKLLGYSREEFIEKRLWQVGAFVDVEANKEAFESLKEKEYMRYEDLPLKTKDGRLIQVEFVSNVYQVGAEKVIQCNIRDITERKRAEVALHESEKRFRNLIDNSPDTIYVHDLVEKRLVFFNREEFCGYSRAELETSNSILTTVHYEDEPAVMSHWRSVLSGEPIEARAIEYRLRRKDGDWEWIQSRETILAYDADGRPREVLVTLTLITKRKHWEESLRISEERLRVTFEATRIATWDWDIARDIWYASTQYYSMLGYPPDIEATSRAVWLNRTHPDDQRVINGKIRDVLDGRDTNYEYEARMLHADGSYRWHYVLGHIVTRDASGKAVRMLGVRMDITERKRAEDESRSAADFLQSVQDALSSHIAILDAEGVIVQVNSSWREFGDSNGLRHPAHCIGENYLEVCDSATGPSSEEASTVARAIRELSRGAKGETRVEYPCHAPAERRWFVARVTAFENSGRKWIVVAHENITERKLAEQRVLRQLEHLTALSAIDRVIAANFDLGLSLSEILTHVTVELGVDAADILILNPHSLMLEFGAARGFRGDAIRESKIPLGEGNAGRVAMDRRLMSIPDLRDEPGDQFLTPYVQGEDFICYFGVPLIAKGQVKGVLGIFHRSLFEPSAEWLGFLNTLAGQTAIAIDNATLFESLQRSNLELARAYDTTIEGWSRALDLRDKETEGHSVRVSEMTVRLARAYGLGEAELVHIRWGALLHDIGKMGVPDGILLKPGPLTAEEWVKMRKHPTLAFEMLSPIRHLRQALEIPYSHHEKWDGTGYPHGLKGIHIPLSARIFAVVDVWDALRSDRPYRAGWPDEKVLDHIRASSGTHFDPQVVDIFMRIPALTGQK